jgi:hypothetical protein
MENSDGFNCGSTVLALVGPAGPRLAWDVAGCLEIPTESVGTLALRSPLCSPGSRRHTAPALRRKLSADTGERPHFRIAEILSCTLRSLTAGRAGLRDQRVQATAEQAPWTIQWLV